MVEPEHVDVVLASVTAELAAGWDVPPAMLPDLPARARPLLAVRFARNRSVRALIGAMMADGHAVRRH